MIGSINPRVCECPASARPASRWSAPAPPWEQVIVGPEVLGPCPRRCKQITCLPRACRRGHLGRAVFEPVYVIRRRARCSSQCPAAASTQLSCAGGCHQLPVASRLACWPPRPSRRAPRAPRSGPPRSRSEQRPGSGRHIFILLPCSAPGVRRPCAAGRRPCHLGERRRRGIPPREPLQSCPHPSLPSGTCSSTS